MEGPRPRLSITELIYWIVAIGLSFLFVCSILLSWPVMMTIWIGIFWVIAVSLLAWVVG